MLIFSIPTIPRPKTHHLRSHSILSSFSLPCPVLQYTFTVVPFVFLTFFHASAHLYKRAGPLVGRSVGALVGNQFSRISEFHQQSLYNTSQSPKSAHHTITSSSSTSPSRTHRCSNWILFHILLLYFHFSSSW